MSEILCSWIGDTDWLVQEGTPKKEDDKGPILRTLENKDWANRISEIHLLNNYENRKANRKSADFKKWLAKKTDAKIVCKSVDLISPTSFTEIDQIATALVRSLPQNANLIYLCSPGTYVMQCVWILLSHNIFPATLIESSKEAGVQEIEVPFNISVKDLIDRADRAREQISDERRQYLPEFEAIQHDCPAMREAVAKGENLASRRISVLIEGEDGTGRELLASCIHKKSGRIHFDSINCDASSPEQLERELFGIIREEAKPGETKRTRGLFQKSRDSTLYIGNVDTLPPQLQTRLLQQINEHEGKTKQRMIFSSSPSLGAAVANGTFRRDLYYLIIQDDISLPPLRERGVKDLELISQALIRRLRSDLQDEGDNTSKKVLDQSAQRALEVFPFEGNVEELLTVLKRAILNSTDTIISRSDIDDALRVSRSSQTIENLLSRPLRPADMKFVREDRSLALDDGYLVINDLLDEVRKHYVGLADKKTRNPSQAANALGLKNYQTYLNWYNKFKDDLES